MNYRKKEVNEKIVKYGLIAVGIIIIIIIANVTSKFMNPKESFDDGNYTKQSIDSLAIEPGYYVYKEDNKEYYIKYTKPEMDEEDSHEYSGFLNFGILVNKEYDEFDIPLFIEKVNDNKIKVTYEDYSEDDKEIDATISYELSSETMQIEFKKCSFYPELKNLEGETFIYKKEIHK